MCSRLLGTGFYLGVAPQRRFRTYGWVGESGDVGYEGGEDGGVVDGERVKGHAGQEQLAAHAAVDSRRISGPGMGQSVDHHSVSDGVGEGLVVVDDPNRTDTLDGHVRGAVTLSGDRLRQLRGGEVVGQ
jgi:hypothetical protein